MSKLYDIVNKTINATSMDEAEQILFGSDGIVINSNEYYKNIISNFGKKKESIIRKNVSVNGKTQLIFDLNNCNDMWNILFIYNYYIRYIDEKIASLNQNITKYKNIKNNLNNEIKKLTPNDIRYQEIIKELESISSILKELGDLKTKYSSYKNDSLKKHVVQLENMENIDEDKLKEYLNKLKEAVNCIQKMRDSFEHSNENLHVDKIVSIDNSRDKFEIFIPIEYLDGFNKGRIIANEEDKILVERTNDISSPLLEALDYDIKKIDSFFYNVEPSYLEFILEKVNYDVNELYKLSSNIFRHKEKTKLFLDSGIDIFTISKLPKEIFRFLEQANMLYKLNIDITKLPPIAIKNVKRTISLYKANLDIYHLPFYVFNEPLKTTFKTIKMLLKANIDIYRLPDSAFSCPEDIIKLYQANIDIYRLPDSAFLHLNGVLKLHEYSIDIYKLPDSAFSYPEGTIKLYQANIDIYRLPGHAFSYYENTIKLYQANIDIYRLPDSAFRHIERVLKLHEYSIDIYNLPEYVFRYFGDVVGILQMNIDITKLPGPFRNLTFPSRNIIELYQANIDIYRLPALAFRHLNGVLKLHEYSIDIYRLPVKAFSCPKSIIELYDAGIDIYKLPDKCFSSNISNLKLILEKVGYEKLDMLPIEIFKCDYNLLDEMVKKYNLNVSKSIFGVKNPKVIAALVYVNSILSNYNKDINTIDMDIKPYSIIGDMYVDNYRYRNNIEENIGREYNSSEFVEQFKLLDENNLDRSMCDIKKVILNKFRNACAHFRFKLVKDKDGNIIEDKIYIYDEDNNGINNFNLIIDLNEFVRIVREVEIELDKQKNKEEQSIQKSR